MAITGPIIEETVNHTSSQVLIPSVATDGSSAYVFVWEGHPLLDIHSHTLAALYNKTNSGLVRNPSFPGDEVISLNTSSDQHHPHVAMNTNQRFCVVWTDQALGPGQGLLFFKIFDQDFSVGNQVTSDLPIPIDPLNTNQDFCKVAMSDTSTASFGVAWLETSPNLVNVVRVAVFDNSNNYATPIFIGTVTSGSSGQPSALDVRIACNNLTGDYFVVWESDVPSNNNVIMGAKFNATGIVGPANGFQISENPFPATDDNTDATGPRIAVRPSSNEFVVTWLHQTPLVTNNVVFNIFWKKMKMETDTPVAILAGTDVGQVPGAVTLFTGGVYTYGDGGFVISWVDQDGVTVWATQYNWEDTVPDFPPDLNNANISPSSGQPHGGFDLTGSVTPFATPPELVFAGNGLVITYGELSMSTLQARYATVDNISRISDFLTTVLNSGSPTLFGNTSVDSNTLTVLSGIFGANNDPEVRNTSNLDSFLTAGQDVILSGGPIFNSMSNDILFQSTLNSNIVNTEATDIFFTVAGDGLLLGTSSPELFIRNQNSSVPFSLERTSTPGFISDYAIIFKLTGTSRGLLFIAGIRDFGTAVAAYVLNNVFLGEGTSTVNPVILRLWTSIFNNSSAIVVKFTMPSSVNNSSVSTALAAIPDSAIQLIPIQSITGNNP